MIILMYIQRYEEDEMMSLATLRHNASDGKKRKEKKRGKINIIASQWMRLEWK